MIVENQPHDCDRVIEASFFIIPHESENRALGHGNHFFKGLAFGFVFACLNEI